MNEELDLHQMLNMMNLPGFCVRQGRITVCNSAAEGLFFTPGMNVSQFLTVGREDYAAFTGGQLYLNVVCEGSSRAASVRRYGDTDLFILEEDADCAELKSMALAARELRDPLSSVMTIADRLFPMAVEDAPPEMQDQVARMNRGLYQMLRVISNMSDAARFSNASAANLETVDINAFFEEIFQRNQPLLAHGGIELKYEPLRPRVFCLADPEKLERAVMNILSNAMKFTPAGGCVEGKLTRVGNRLALSVRDTGCGIPEQLRGTLHSRYTRQAGLEDGRFGIGLGMVLIRSAAASHGGTVLIDHPDDCGTRITMTMAIRQDNSGNLRSNILRVDYAGERDHSLIELSQSLPSQLYNAENAN